MWNTNMFGPDLLVSPIMHQGARSQTVYLPTGSFWANTYTSETLKCGVSISVKAPLE
ncbi:MAG: hypothetical protein ACQEXQ_08785 [Bacillota bacterium]